MNAITLKNLSEEASRALEALADANGTSAEIEAERILQDALSPLSAHGVGSSGKDFVEALQRLGEEYPGLSHLNFSRDQTPARGVEFE